MVQEREKCVLNIYNKHSYILLYITYILLYITYIYRNKSQTLPTKFDTFMSTSHRANHINNIVIYGLPMTAN